MMRNTTPQPPKTRKLPGAGATLTKPQKLILFLAGLLLVAWMILAGLFILSSRVSIPPASTQAVQQPLPTEPGLPESSPTPVQVLISAACARQNSGVVQGTVSSVDAQGVVEVITAGGSFQAQFAGIKLFPEDQPGEETLQAIRNLVLNQQVLLVRDGATGAETQPLSRYIFTPEKFINDELVHLGLAERNPDTVEQSCAAVFQLSEQKARSAKLGMWAPTRVPTLTFVPFVTLDTSQQPPCDCSIRHECSDFTTHAEAQACYNACNDYNSRLDDDHDGIACESLP